MRRLVRVGMVIGKGRIFVMCAMAAPVEWLTRARIGLGSRWRLEP